MTLNAPQSSQDKLESNLMLLQDGMHQLSVGVSIFDSDLLLVACNRRFIEIFDLPATLLQVGSPLAPVLLLLAERGVYGTVDVDAFVRAAIASLRTTEMPFSFERCVADGQVYESHTTRLESGGFITIHTDITHHKQAEKRLWESQQILSEKTTELELILENASLGILTVVPSSAGRRVMRRVNRALEQLLGYGPDELEGMDTRLLYPNNEEYSAVTAAYADTVCCGYTYQAEHVFARKDGDTILAILRGSAIDPRDPSRGVIWLIEDISERQRIETELAAKTALLQAGTDNMSGAMVIWDSELRYIWWTPRTEQYFNLPPGTLKVGLPMLTMARYFAERGDFGPGDIAAQIEMQMHPFYAREVMLLERNMPDGSVLEVRRNPLPDGGFVSVFQAITERKRLETELRQAVEAAEATAKTLRRKQQQVATLLNSSGQGFLSFGADFVVDSEFSQACLTLLGGSPAGRNIVDLLFPDDAERREQLRLLAAPIFTGEVDARARSFLLMQLSNEFRRGELYLEADFRLLENGHLMVVLTDVTDAKRFKTLSATDRLTGIANRRKLDEVLDYEHQRSNRTSSPLAAIIADIDHFKAINDNYGHMTGDQVLIEIAKLLQRGVRQVDSVGRWGGEEFMILCPDTGLSGAGELAEKLRQVIAAHQFVGVGQKTCSFGVAEYCLGESIESLIHRADAALYQAKEGGRNQVAVVADLPPVFRRSPAGHRWPAK